MKLQVDELSTEPTEMEVVLDPGWTRAALPDVLLGGGEAGGRATVRAYLVGEKINVDGKISATLSVPCSRCLEEAKIRVAEPFRRIFEARRAEHALPRELELEEEDLDWEVFDGREIDLGPVLREQLLLAVPMAPVCREDCPGVDLPRGEPGDDPEVDPRWAALAKIKAKR